MKRFLLLAVFALFGFGASARADILNCLNHGIHCICPCPTCPDCTGPCEHRLHLCTCHQQASAQKLIEQLSSACTCDRLHAAEKLGCRLHADFCCTPEILGALVHALQCDPCWEVRKAAAWSIAYQGARVDAGVMALYLASKLDPHYLVRDAATDALGVVLIGRGECFRDTFARADALIKTFPGGRYKPGTPECLHLAEACAGVVARTAPAGTSGADLRTAAKR
jgi:HEAT repeats